MTARSEEIGEAMAALTAAPGFASLLGPGVPALLWSVPAERILWASPRAQDLAGALSGNDGRVDEALPALARLRLLGAGLAPRDGTRLEKLRLAGSALVPAATLACRLVRLPSGEDALLTAFIGPLPKLKPRAPALPAPAAPEARPDPASGEAVESPPAPEDGPRAPAADPDDAPAEDAVAGALDAAPEPAAPGEAEERQPAPDEPARQREQPGSDHEAAQSDEPAAPAVARPVRFVWRTDAEARFLSVSESLAQVVGPEAAAIVGLSVDEVLASRAVDPLGIIPELFARRETWSGRSVHWRVDGSAGGIIVELGGLPLYDTERRLVGFRGFGLCRPDMRVEMPGAVETRDDALKAPPDPPPAEEPAPEAPPAQGAATPEPDQQPQETPAEEPDQIPARSADLPGSSPPDGMDAAPHPAAREGEAPSRSTAEPDSGDDSAAPVDPAGSAAEAPESEPAAAEAPVDAPSPISEGPPADEADAVRTAVPKEADAPDDAAAQAPDPEAPSTGGTAPAAFLSLGGRVGGRLGDAHPLPLRSVEAPRADVALPEPGAAAPSPSQAQASGSDTASRLTSAERSAFREIARALGARFVDELPEEPAAPTPRAGEPADEPTPKTRALGNVTRLRPLVSDTPSPTALLDRIPIGVLIHRGETALFVNRLLLDLLDYDTLAAFEAAGGLARLFRGRPNALARSAHDGTSPLTIATREGESIAVEIRVTTCDWEGYPASLMLVRKVPESDPTYRIRALEQELEGREARLEEQSAILDTATDGVVVLDDHGRILTLNRSAEALFGYEQNEVAGEPLTLLLATESHIAALDYLEGLRENGVASLLNDGREVMGRVRQGGAIPLFMTLGRISERPERKFCAVVRDITAFKKAEGELVSAKRAAERASSQKSDFLAKISHEIRTPLNAIIGFAEVMLEERFGPVGNERYRDYLSDIHSSGEHVISLVNDLLDLAKIEAGRMELSFGSVHLNELVNACVALMQPQAARERIVMRMSFAPKLPPIVADERSLRQIVLNLLSNAVKFTDAGGQVIVSTALTERGEVVFRVRDTGIGMTETELEAALEPFRQLATSRKGGGTGLGLPLTKALVEANRAALAISSTKNEGTLVEVVFPPTRVLAE